MPGTFSQDKIPGFCMCKNGFCAIETEADIAEHGFSKGQHELKTLKCIFLNQHLKIYHFTLFLKPVIEILRKRTVVISIIYIWLINSLNF